ncbi:hypothetical protein [Pseudoalteromonas sp. T1lg24]|uniref:hypothetical protein n=1 Tax=Pseudoalteromonas sp. T1lg24 TaxID=2077099 RepID=UPI000CF60FDF|nr:hypothetical protein [Pseudoalteromonas sp. T1lg24]
MKKLISPVIGMLSLALCAKADAHFPTLNCHVSNTDAKLLSCTAGYSDASLAGEVILKVYSYDEALLREVKTASDGSVSFSKPNGEFYIVFDAGHESPAEFDYAELE